jgi:hypothetical protein
VTVTRKGSGVALRVFERLSRVRVVGRSERGESEVGLVSFARVASQASYRVRRYAKSPTTSSYSYHESFQCLGGPPRRAGGGADEKGGEGQRTDRQRLELVEDSQNVCIRAGKLEEGRACEGGAISVFPVQSRRRGWSRSPCCAQNAIAHRPIGRR